MRKHGIFCLLAAICLLLAACGEKPEEPDAAPLLAGAYTAVWTGVDGGMEFFVDGCISGEAAYVFGTQKNADAFLRLPLAGGAAQPLPEYQPGGAEGSYTSRTGIRPGEDGTLWVLERCVFIQGDKTIYLLRQLDEEGKELRRISSEGWGLGSITIYDMLLDGSGDIYAATNKGVTVLDGKGQARFSLEMEVDLGGLDLIRLGDGRVGVPEWTRDVSGKTVSRLRTIDKDGKGWGEDYPLPMDHYGRGVFEGDGNILFYYLNGESLYAWQTGAEAGEPVLNWLAAGVAGEQVRSVSRLPDGRLAAVARGSNMSDVGFYLLTPVEEGALPERTVLTYATVNMTTDERTAILAFNNANPDYYIEVTDYAQFNTSEDWSAGRTRLITEVLAGNVPDLLNVGQLGTSRWGAMGLLEDLWPYIDNDPELNREDLMERVFQALETDGKLYQVGSTFRIMTLTGASSVVGEDMTWTPADFWDALASMPEGAIPLVNSGSKDRMLKELLNLGGDRFVDWDEGTCHFDSEEFKDLLTFCNSFPNQDALRDAADITGMVSGMQMLCEWQLTDFYAVQKMAFLFGGAVTFVGYPNEWGEVGSAFYLPRSYAISSASAHKDGAWAFLRTLLLPNTSANVFREFPTNKADFQQLAEQMMKPEQVDASGREIPTNGFYFGEVDGMELHCTYHAVTQEEYDQMMALYNAIDRIYAWNDEINEIAVSAAGAYFAGDKTLDEAAELIQNRASLYVSEQK